MITLGAFAEAVIRRVASIPSRTGIRTSISITSGRCSPATQHGFLSVPGGGDHLEIAGLVDDHAKPFADEGVIVDQSNPDHATSNSGKPAAHLESSRSAGAKHNDASMQRSPLADPAQPATGSSVATGAVIRNDDRQIVADPDLHRGS